MANPIIVPRRLEDWFDQRTGQMTLRAVKFFELLTGTTNTAVEDIASNEESLTSNGSRVSRNAAKINALELDDFVVIVTTVNDTSNLNNIFICKNPDPIEITLDPQAIEGDEVHVKRRNAKVTVIGTVDGKENPVINIKNYSMHAVFDGVDWSEI